MPTDRREVIFDMPNTYGEYRMVCRFGYNEFIDYAWWGHLQRKVIKKPLLWGKEKEVWVEIDKCWWSTEVESMEQLKKSATKFYDDNVEMIIRIKNRAINLK